MNIDKTRYTSRPTEKRTPAEEAIYDKLDALSIPFVRVDHDHADTIDDCLLVEEVLGDKICKNLFLTNRQQTDFYVLMMEGDKPFKTKDLSPLLGCARLSFASADHMSTLLNTSPGSVSGLEMLFDTEHRVQLVIDKDLWDKETISGHPGLSTSTLCLQKADFSRFVEATGHSVTVVDLPDLREA